VTQQFGLDLCRRLNELLTAGRTGVAAAALLATPAGGISRQEFVRRVGEIVELLRHLEVPLGDVVERDLRAADLSETVMLLEKAGLIRRVPDRRGEILAFDDRAREILDYYRGGLAFPLVLAGSLALALQQRSAPESLIATAAGWLDLLSLEVLPPERPELEARLTDLIAFAEGRGFVNTDLEGRLSASEKGEAWCALLAAQVRPLLEAYRALIEAVLELGGSAKRQRVEEEARALHERHLLLGEAEFPEGLCRATLGNGLRWLVQERYLEGDPNLRRGDAEVRPGPQWEKLEALCERVAAPLTGG
jgi:glycerol-3-phosphate O-acyltransferase